MAYIIFVVLGIGSSLISAVFGFGTALVLLAVGAYILPVKQVIVLATIMFTASNLTKTCIYVRQIDWKVAGIVGLGCLPFAYLGAELLSVAPTGLIRRLLGLMIIAYIILTSYKFLPRFKVGYVTLTLGAGLYGFLSGLLGSGNLIKVILFKELKIEKESFVGVMAATAILVNVIKSFSYFNNGLFTAEMIIPSIGLVMGAFIMVFMGRYYLTRMSSRHFEIGVKFILLVSAIGLLF